MKTVLWFIFFFAIGTNINCASEKQSIITPRILKVEMNLSAFGVESDNFPSIYAVLDFENDSSSCDKSYYNPAFKGGVYRLTKNEMRQILSLLQKFDLSKVKSEYTVQKTDQPTSTTTIHLSNHTFVFKDYGLIGEPPLKELYKIVYKF